MHGLVIVYMSITEEFGIKKILFNQYNSLGKLCSISKKIVELDALAKQNIAKINPELVSFCQVSSFADGCLIIEVARSEILTVLKFNSMQLISSLRAHSELLNLITIKYKVNPVLIPPSSNQSLKPKTQSHNTAPSSATKDAIENISSQIKNQALREALLRLIK